MSTALHLVGPAPTFRSVLGEELPDLRLWLVRKPAGPRVEPLAVAAAVADALAPACARLRPGARVALAVGSRGIAQIGEVVAACAQAVRQAGAEPFVVPAMGPHGGATAAGQADTLRSLGVSKDTVDAPVLATMETVRLGQAGPRLEVFFDRQAAEADAILLVNRVKSHTSFSGQIESGLAKMLAIGLGKQEGAKEIHRLGPLEVERRIVAAASFVVGQLPVIGGLALVEDEAKSLGVIRYLEPSQIGQEAEAELLRLAKSFESRLPFAALDVLIVDAMGKELSGTGMDTNVIGRRMIRGSPEIPTPVVTNIVALSVTPGSHGNAMGLGMADFVPERLMRAVDLEATYANALTAGLQGVQHVQIPITLATDHDAVGAAIRTASIKDLAAARVVRAHDTLHLDQLMVSPALLGESARAGYQVVGAELGPAELFGSDGQMAAW